MSEPITRNEHDVWQQYPRNVSRSVETDESMKVGGGNANRITIDFGKQANTLTICAIICGICAASTVGMYLRMTDRERDVNNKLQVSENHWRNIETDVETLKRVTYADRK